MLVQQSICQGCVFDFYSVCQLLSHLDDRQDDANLNKLLHGKISSMIEQSITLSLRSVATTGVQLIIMRRILSLRSNSYNWRTAVQFLNTFSVKVNDHNVTLNSMHWRILLVF